MIYKATRPSYNTITRYKKSRQPENGLAATYKLGDCYFFYLGNTNKLIGEPCSMVVRGVCSPLVSTFTTWAT
jgi:hypothetical protein